MGAVARHSGQARDVMMSAAAGPEPVLPPTEADMEFGYRSAADVQQILGLVHSSRKGAGAGATRSSRW